MARTAKTDAIVLRSLRYGEADRILHLYTADRGRVGAIAKGVRKTSSRFGARNLFAAAIAVPAIGYRWFGLNAVTAFWSAYVLTRPLGASVADWLALPPYRGGLDLGSGPVALALAVVIAGFVAFLAVTKVDTPSGALH